MPIGAVVLGKLISVLEAEQVDRKNKERNERVIAIPIELTSREPMLPVVEFSSPLQNAISQFFVKYNELQGRKFYPIRYASSSRAVRLVRKACLRP